MITTDQWLPTVETSPMIVYMTMSLKVLSLWISSYLNMYILDHALFISPVLTGPPSTSNLHERKRMTVLMTESLINLNS